MEPRASAMTARRPVPKRHWRSYGDAPLPSGPEALDEPFSAFPSWFMCITCDRCGKDRMLNEARTASARDIVDHCCDAWNRLIDQPWTIMSIGLRECAYG
jgi:hypothetical protein